MDYFRHAARECTQSPLHSDSDSLDQGRSYLFYHRLFYHPAPSSLSTPTADTFWIEIGHSLLFLIIGLFVMVLRDQEYLVLISVNGFFVQDTRALWIFPTSHAYPFLVPCPYNSLPTL